MLQRGSRYSINVYVQEGRQVDLTEAHYSASRYCVPSLDLCPWLDGTRGVKLGVVYEVTGVELLEGCLLEVLLAARSVR